MLGNDLVQVVVGASCVICVTPLLIFWVMLRLAIGLERLLMRHSLLLWLLPIFVWLRANQLAEREWNERNSDGCYR
jgi:hypothetical protein